MAFQPVDRLPVIEWAMWWDLTIARWRTQGLPESLTDAGDIRDYFGMDAWRQFWLPVTGPGFPFTGEYGKGPVADMDDYLRVRKCLFPDPETLVQRSWLDPFARRQEAGETVLWITLNGFFAFPRMLFGIERHMYAFYEQPELMHAMNKDLLEHSIRLLDAFSAIVPPCLLTIAEDMSYNHGPMISKDLFDTFLAPYYRPLIERARAYGIQPVVDTDGNIHALAPWFIGIGVDGFLPIERRAGCDPAALREAHPEVRLIGGFDKTVMASGEAAIRDEFEHLLPAMRSGGFIPSVDHQTPPEVSLDTYRVYLRLLREYAEKAC